MRSTLRIFLFSLALLPVQTVSGAQFFYVLQNPAYFGGGNSKTGFEIDGLENKEVQARINSTLRSEWTGISGLEPGPGSASMHHGGPAPEGYSDYHYYNSTTENCGWVRFKNSDSLLRLPEVQHNYGQGTDLESFYSVVAAGKMAWISFQVFVDGDYLELVHKEITFSLVDGRVLPNACKIPFSPHGRDTIKARLDEAARNSFKLPDSLCTLAATRPLPDSCTITSEALICWLNRENSRAPGVIGMSYMPQCKTGAGLVSVIAVGYGLNFVIPFLHEESWQKLQRMYE